MMFHVGDRRMRIDNPQTAAPQTILGFSYQWIYATCIFCK
jgi:hypothetical protein